MMDGGTCTTSPLLRSITELSKQQSTLRPIFFSLPGHWKATRYYLLLPKLHYYRTLYCYLKWLDSTEFLIWQSIGARSLVPQASDQQQSCNCDDAPVTFRPKPECWLKIGIPPDFIWGTEAMHFEGFLITENSKEVVMSRTDMAALGPGHSFRIKEFQITFMCCMNNTFFYYWCCHLPIR